MNNRLYNTLKLNNILKLGIACILMALLAGLFVFGFTFGVMIFILAGVSLLLIGIANHFYFQQQYKSIMKPVRYVLVTTITIWVTSFIIIQCLIILYSQPDTCFQAEYAIVLGAGLRDGEPSALLRQRLDIAVEYGTGNPDATIIVSGGQGQGDGISEAEAMGQYLTSKGIDSNRIIKEKKATNTIENIVYSQQAINVLNGSKNQEVVIITSEYHLFRAKYIARKNGLIAYGMPSKTPLFVRLNYSIKEYFSIIKLFIISPGIQKNS